MTDNNEPTDNKPDAKPDLVLLRGKDITAESLAEMFRFLTGKDSTPEEIEEIRVKLEKASGPCHDRESRPPESRPDPDAGHI